MDPRTLVMTSGPEELPFPQNELFESDFSDAVAQVNFELNSEPCLGVLGSGYDGDKGSWAQPWQGGEDKLSTHLPIKAQCDSLDLFGNELSPPGCPLFSTISNELFAREADLSMSSSLEFNTRVFMNAGVDPATQGAAKTDTDQNGFGGCTSNKYDSFAAESVAVSKPGDLMTPSNQETGSCNGDPCEQPEVAPGSHDCDEEMETNVEENEDHSLVDTDLTVATETCQSDNHIPRTDVDEDELKMDVDSGPNETNKLDDQVTSNDQDDLNEDTLMTEKDDDQIRTDEEGNQVDSDMMEHDTPPCPSPGIDVSRPPSPLNPEATEKLVPLPEMPSSDTEETMTEPHDVDRPTPSSGEQSPIVASSLENPHQMRRFHPVVILHLNESVNPTSESFQCASCQHTAVSADLLIDHHYKCHPVKKFGSLTRTGAQEDICGKTNDGPPVTPRSVKTGTLRGPYRCTECRITFRKINPYVTHMRKHTGKTPYVCERCGLYFAQASGVRRHQSYSRACQRAQQRAKNASSCADARRLQQEMTSQDISGKMPECFVKLRKITKVHECTYCRKTFLSLVKAKKHQQIVHTGTTSSVIVTKRILNRKTSSSEAKYTFKCPICPRFFKYSFNRGRHLRKCVKEKVSKGGEKVGQKFECPMCPATFTATSNRYRHIKNFCLRKTISRLSKEEFNSSKPNIDRREDVRSPKSGSRRVVRGPKNYVAEKEEMPLKEMTSGEKFKCRFCPAVYQFQSGMFRHMRKHRLAQHTGGRVRCRTSEEKSENNSEKVETQTSPMCRICLKSFTTISSARRHELIHKRVLPYACSECGLRFKNGSHLTEHKSIHQGKILCRVCLKIFPTIAELIRHCELHHQSGNLKCPDCLQSFRELSSFIRHLESLRIKTITPDQEDKPSDKATRRYRNASLENATVQEKETKEKDNFKAPYSCEICHIEFPRKNFLYGHMLGHKLKTLIECNNCGKCFARKKIHRHISTCQPVPSPLKVEPPVAVSPATDHIFKCPTCTRTFTVEYHYRRHIKGHKNHTLRRCYACGQYFASSGLGDHKSVCPQWQEEAALSAAAAAIPDDSTDDYVIHPPKKKYPCTICPRMLDKKVRLMVHHSDHEKNILIVCPKGCGCYYRPQRLPVHINVCVGASKSASSKKPKFKCPHCPQQFKYRCYLLRHSKSHCGLQPYPCSHCGERFPSHIKAKQHQQTCINGEAESPKHDDGESHDSSTLHEESDQQGTLQYKCTFCNKSFLKARNLRNHILTHNEAKPYRCKSCRSSFSRFDHLKVHQAGCKTRKLRLEICIPKLSPDDVDKALKTSLNKDPEEEIFECKVCFKTFPFSSTLKRHTILFHTVKPFKCEDCGATFTLEKSLLYHQKKHCIKLKKYPKGKAPTKVQKELTVTLDHVCNLCSLSFASIYSLKTHMLLHNSVMPFSCQHCGEQFPRKDYLVRHFLKCTVLESKESLCSSQEKPGDDQTPVSDRGFSCAYCSSRFSLFSQLQEHFLNVHQLETADQPVTTASLQHHLSNMSDSKDTDERQLDKNIGGSSRLPRKRKTLSMEASTSYECPTCGKILKHSGAYKAHLRTHTAPYFNCDICGSGFWNKLILRKHKQKCKAKAALGETKFHKIGGGSGLSSNITSKPASPTIVLSAKSYLEKSGKSTKEEVRYQCSECHKSFTDGLLLITHLEDHRKEELKRKQHSCSLCHKVCDSQSSLDKHMRIHCNDEKYSCPDCAKVLNTKAEYDRHRSFHDQTRTFACKLCTYRFKTGPSLCAHYNAMHPEKMLKCRFCDRTYTIGRSLARHCLKHHKDQVKRGVPSAPSGNRTHTDEKVFVRDCQKNPNDEDRSGTLQPPSSEENEMDDSEDQHDEDSDSDAAPYFPCHVCGKTFKTSESLEDHQRCHLGEKPHECAECGKCFYLAGQLEHHQRMHKSEFQCQLCGKGFVSQFALRKHKATHIKSRAHRCPKCRLIFTGAAQLAEHMASHSEENFPCDICDRVFNSKSSRYEHRKTHTLELAPRSGQKKPETAPLRPEYRCGDCNECFAESKALLEHGCISTEERRFKCSTCSKHFLHASHLIMHQSTQHPGVECSTDSLTSELKKELDHQTDFICSVCNRSFTNGDQLNKHFSTHSNEVFVKEEPPSTSELDIRCSVCGRSFSGSEAYAQHECTRHKTDLAEPLQKNQGAVQAAPEDEEVDVISGDVHSCADCTMSYPSQSALLEHRTIHHENIKQYKCRICAKAFAYKAYLAKHMKRHLNKQTSTDATDSGEVVLMCDQCGTTMASEQELSSHMCHHLESKEGLHSCDLCLQSFTHWSLLKRHQESHMGQIVYECNECDKAFAFPYLLEEHQQTHASHK